MSFIPGQQTEETSNDNPQETTESVQDEIDFLYRINNVFAFIKANEATQLVSSYTLGDYIDQALVQLEGPLPNGRPSRKERLKKINEDIQYVTNKLRQ